MGKVYDDWGRLVEAVIRREKFRQLCYEHSRTSSDCSSDSSTLLDELNRREDLLGGPSDWLKDNLISPMVEMNSTTLAELDLLRGHNDPNVYSQNTLPVVEEPSSSFFEAADDDPLPAIEGLQVSGDAFPGRQIQACGFTKNGATTCKFQWVRHLKDGSFLYVDGAHSPNYLVTADDLNTFLAIEVQPHDDDRKRKGNIERVFANEHRKIGCHPEMLKCIEQTYYSGHASYNLSLSTLYMREPATLNIKRDGYSLKSGGPAAFLVTEKFSSSTIVCIPFGSLMEFSITDSKGTVHHLRVDKSSSDISGSRDTIVLTLRLFILKASEKKQQKVTLFFSKQRTK